MKRSDLFREWARVIDMCEGTGVDPKECVKINGHPSVLDHPNFNAYHPSLYVFAVDIVKDTPIFDLKKADFAVAILEGKPVFIGDEVYWKNSGDKFDWDKGELCHADYYQNLTRTQPARTITLNGEKLPAPDDGSFYLYVAGFNHIQYGFKNGEDLIKVESAINKLLRGE